MSDIEHVLKVLDIEDDGKDIVKNKVGMKKILHFHTRREGPVTEDVMLGYAVYQVCKGRQHCCGKLGC